MWEGEGLMIRFCCEHCGHKIGVQDKLIGKRGKCPECGGIVGIPAKSILIECYCQNCDRKINVPKTLVGKEIQCPDCKDRFIVPATGSDIPLAPETPPAQTTNSTGILTHLDLPQEYRIADQPPAQPYRPQELIESEREYEMTPSGGEDATMTERHLPWPIDIFLYPTSKAGMKTLAIIVLIPLFIGIMLRLIGSFSEQSPLVFVLHIPVLIVGLIVEMLLYLYSYGYFCECIRESAYGSVRAPETLGTTPGFWDILWQTLRTIACFIVVSAPTAFYYGYARQTDTIFWVLLFGGLFVFPMAVLAVILFDSLMGLNPILLIGSIFSTFFPYCGLVLLATIIVLIARLFMSLQETGEGQQSWATEMFLGTLFYGIWLYTVFIVAHVLGRFYWRNQKKLNWEV